MGRNNRPRPDENSNSRNVGETQLHAPSTHLIHCTVHITKFIEISISYIDHIQNTLTCFHLQQYSSGDKSTRLTPD